MTRLGLDYSAGRIWGGTVRAAGYDFVIRYVDDAARGLTSKHVRPDEYADLRANGVDVWLVFEIGTTDWAGGFNAGVANAQRARRGADWIGYPAGGTIFFCADMHLTGAQVPTALAYLDGAASVLGRASVGCYGFYEYVDAAIAGGHAGSYWQCGIRPAASDPVQVYQRNYGTVTVGGIGCDVNELLRPIGGGEPDMDFSSQYTDWAGNVQTLGSILDHLDQRTYNLEQAILGLKQSRYVAPDGTASTVQLSALDAILDNNAADYENVDRLAAVQGAVQHLTDTLASLSNLDGDEIASKVQEAIVHALAENTVHVDVEVGGQPAPTPPPVPPAGAPKS